MPAVQTLVAVVPGDPASCWRAFTNADAFAAWIPGLRRAQVVHRNEAGLPTEIVFELGASRTYSLAYTYDVTQHEVRWEPRSNKRDAVAGFARFEAVPVGTQITYGLANQVGATSASDMDELIAAFIRYLKR